MSLSRFATFFSLVAALFLAGCAAEGIIVKKSFRPLPFSYSLGLDGIYKFELEDRQKEIREQMVTRDVFLRYEVGDFFSDRMETMRATAENAQRDAARLGSHVLLAREPNSIYEEEPLIAPRREVRVSAAPPAPAPISRKPEKVSNIHISVVKSPSHEAKAVHRPGVKPAAHKRAATPVQPAKPKASKSAPTSGLHSAASAKAIAEEADAATSAPEPKPHFRGLPEPGMNTAPHGQHVLEPRDRPTNGAQDSGRDTEGF